MTGQAEGDGPSRWAGPPPAAAPPAPYRPESGSVPSPRPRRRGLTGGVVAVVIVLAAVALMGVVPRERSGYATAVPGTVERSDVGRSPGAGSPVGPRLETNPLLADGIRLARVSCELPELGRQDAQLQGFYRALAGCLEQAWRPALDRAGDPTLPATVSVTLPKVSTCGAAPSKEEAVAYYCGGDTTIYAPTAWMLSDAGLNRSRHLATIAHEYGHHVQRESGILAAAADRMTTPDQRSPADRAVVRRIELQANCFGALFIASAIGQGSVGRSVGNAAVADYGRADDSEDHGSRAHQLSWAEAGFSGGTTAACNTWSAPADRVG
ncbi:neutral zinc metallopeptidase [Amycolatopsis sp. PS_44_ISF1]|uniref:neutral zinc metallopeptidase n=1 Tax=Amycolatopsis sp. PS_44_ISF1 TaxID=2974917 RepID=UPI0028DFB486|nr:neutral zinc metallopeptidase [Amycolatopsis sp. PS_44_ISF1]MDT8914257.1 neutral zinc metallopeptidase [Amycolatopsis sp. PS_44_ISF1]